jgi:pimeloyl-ACP methyl ester carboxylesterase
MATNSGDEWLHISGPTAGSTLVLVHGSVLSRRMWQPLIPALDREFRVVAPDLPGHGTLGDRAFSIDAAVAHLAGLRSAAGFGTAVWVGASMGGFLTMALASRDSAQVAGLVLSGCSMPMNGATRLWVKFVAAPLMAQLDVGWARRRMASRVRTLFGPQQRAAAEATIDAGFAMRPAATFFREGVDVDFREGLRGFRPPVLVLNGASDRPSCRGAAGLAALCAHAEVETLPRAGHACSMEQPAAFADSVARFARRTFESR